MKHPLFIRPLLLLACCVLLLTACIKPTPNLTAPAENANPLRGTKWQLVSLEQQEALAAAAVTVEFSDDALTGSAGCNTYSAAYQLRDQTIMIGGAAATRKACADEQQMAQETTYFEALATVTQFQLVDKQLELRNEQGEVVMVFAHR